MKLYAQFNNLGTEYDTYAPIAISTTPFNDDCWEIEFDGNEIITQFPEIEDIMKVWKPYNIVVPGDFCYLKTKTGKYKSAIEIPENERDYFNVYCRCIRYIKGDISDIFYSQFRPNWAI